MDKNIYLDKAANGHNWLNTESRRAAKRVGRYLMFRHGFIRWGVYIPPIADEAILPSYIRWGLRIHSGWDNWIAYDFLSANDETDTFLEQFVARHIPEIKDIRVRT